MKLSQQVFLGFAVLVSSVSFADAGGQGGIAPGFAIPDNDPSGASSNLHAGPIDNGVYSLAVRTYWPNPVSAGGHPWVGDLVARLTYTPDTGGSPISCDLFNRVGATSATSLGDSSDLRAVYIFTNLGLGIAPGNFWDAAGAAGPNQPVLGGYYNPSTRDANFQYQQITFTEIFGSSVGPGTWTLTISDNAPGNTGTLSEWRLDFIPAPSTATLFALPAAAAPRRRRPTSRR